MTDWPSASTQLPWRAPRPSSSRLVPLKPTSMMTCDPRGILGTTGAAAAVVPASMTSGLYTCSAPFGDRMVASTNACSVPVASEQPSPSCHGVARPRALSGLFGTVSVQFSDAAAWSAFWFRLMAAPVPSTGLVARSPSWLKAIRPVAKLGAAGTAAATAALLLALADGQGEAEALAAAAGLPDAAGLADGEPHAPIADWLMVVTGPPETARMIPRVSPNAIG